MKKKNKLPPWIRVKVPCGKKRESVKGILEEYNLHTVCKSAQCPNLTECWHKGTATFMILGNECTRNCKFCAVRHNSCPPPPNPDEPENIAKAAKELKLKYVVVTSVTRDDLNDGGASHFAKVIEEIHKLNPSHKNLLSEHEEIRIEVLTPDFKGKVENIATVIEAAPTVFNHNIETVERLSSLIRNNADYNRSLYVLSTANKLANGTIPVKSGFMLGLGETDKEVEKTIKDIYNAGASILTIGQYLRPSKNNYEVVRYVQPEKFEYWADYAKDIGFSFVASAPLVRSSYAAEKAFIDTKKLKN